MTEKEGLKQRLEKLPTEELMGEKFVVVTRSDLLTELEKFKAEINLLEVLPSYDAIWVKKKDVLKSLDSNTIKTIKTNSLSEEGKK